MSKTKLDAPINIGEMLDKPFGEVMETLLPFLSSGSEVIFYIYAPDATLEMCLHVAKVLSPISAERR